MTEFGKSSPLQVCGSGAFEHRNWEREGKRPLGRRSRKWKGNITGVKFLPRTGHEGPEGE